MFLKLLSYPRSIVATIFSGLFTLGLSALAAIGTFIFPGRRFQNAVLVFWSKTLMWAIGVEIKVQGLENLHPGGAVFVFNHTSLLDIPIFHSEIRKTTRFGAKIELYKIPFFSAALRTFGALPIARGEREKVLELYRNSIAQVHAGESFILAGEGTRHAGDGVGERFKSGPFIFAIQGQVPVQPLVIKGASKILPKSGFVAGWGRWKSPVTLMVLPAVPTTGLALEDRDRLKQTVHQMMTKAYAQS